MKFTHLQAISIIALAAVNLVFSFCIFLMAILGLPNWPVLCAQVALDVIALTVIFVFMGKERT